MLAHQSGGGSGSGWDLVRDRTHAAGAREVTGGARGLKGGAPSEGGEGLLETVWPPSEVGTSESVKASFCPCLERFLGLTSLMISPPRSTAACEDQSGMAALGGCHFHLP